MAMDRIHYPHEEWQDFLCDVLVKMWQTLCMGEMYSVEKYFQDGLQTVSALISSALQVCNLL